MFFYTIIFQQIKYEGNVVEEPVAISYNKKKLHLKKTFSRMGSNIYRWLIFCTTSEDHLPLTIIMW